MEKLEKTTKNLTKNSSQLLLANGSSNEIGEVEYLKH